MAHLLMVKNNFNGTMTHILRKNDRILLGFHWEIFSS